MRRLRLAVLISSAATVLGCDAFTSLFDEGEEELSTTPVRILTAETVVEVQASGGHICARTVDDETWCWGANDLQQLGGPSSGDCQVLNCSRRPVRASTSPFRQLAVAQSGARSCALDADGVTWCWGYLAGQQDGSGTLRTASAPQRVTDAPSFSRLVLEDLRNCGIRDTELWCWGYGFQGSFGHGENDTRSAIPIRIADSLSVVGMDIGWTHSCLLTSEGSTYCWGSTWYGALGTGDPPQAFPNKTYNAPQRVLSAPAFAAIAVGSSFTCGLTAAGETYCWGSNTVAGGTGLATLTPRLIAGAPAFTRLYAGHNHACGLTATGDLHCWGDNFAGELGDGSTESRSTPARVRLPAPVVQVSDHPTCAVTEAGALYCWGPNFSGQLAR